MVTCLDAFPNIKIQDVIDVIAPHSAPHQGTGTKSWCWSPASALEDAGQMQRTHVIVMCTATIAQIFSVAPLQSLSQLHSRLLPLCWGIDSWSES